MPFIGLWVDLESFFGYNMFISQDMGVSIAQESISLPTLGFRKNSFGRLMVNSQESNWSCKMAKRIGQKFRKFCLLILFLSQQL